MTNFDKFCEVNTVHEAIIQYWWSAKRLHDHEYRSRINDRLREIVKLIEKYYDVKNDTLFCCQWEGFRLYGSDLETVKEAAKMLVSKISSFQDIKALSEYD